MQKVNHRHSLLVILFIYLFLSWLWIKIQEFFSIGVTKERLKVEISWQEGGMGASLSHRLIGNSCGTLIVH
jgi:hypothetical protein